MSNWTFLKVAKGGFVFAFIYLVGNASYGDIASDLVMQATAVVALIIGIVVCTFDLDIGV